ncbi:MAG: GerMN domain-containing protein [Candidatus Paceibacterota bacterium]|jgi:spore germination protein GerM
MKEKIDTQKRITLFIIVLLIVGIGFVVVSRYKNRFVVKKIVGEKVLKMPNVIGDDLVGGTQNTMQVSVFFPNPTLANDPESMDCSKVFPVVRTVERVPGVARQALQELLLGPTEGERGDGYITIIPQEIGLHINSVNLDQGLLTIVFNRPPFMGGSCALAGVLSQIRSTAMQFPSVKEVEMLVEGNEEWMNP